MKNFAVCAPCARLCGTLLEKKIKKRKIHAFHCLLNHSISNNTKAEKEDDDCVFILRAILGCTYFHIDQRAFAPCKTVKFSNDYKK